jgi:hypothetical protein
MYIISWTDHVKKEVLRRVKEERNFLYTLQWGRLTGLVTLHKNYLLKHVIEGQTEGRLEVT